MPGLGPGLIESYMGDILIHPLTLASDWWFSTLPAATCWHVRPCCCGG